MQWTIAQSRCKQKTVRFFAITKISESQSGGDAAGALVQKVCHATTRRPEVYLVDFIQCTLARESSAATASVAHEELLYTRCLNKFCTAQKIPKLIHITFEILILVHL